MKYSIDDYKKKFYLVLWKYFGNITWETKEILLNY